MWPISRVSGNESNYYWKSILLKRLTSVYFIFLLIKFKFSFIKIGLSYQNLGDYEQALIWFSEATKKNPQNPKPFLNKASSLSGLKRFKEAIECCNVAIKLDPSLALAYSMKGDAHMFLNEHKHAVEMFTMALKLDPNNSEKLLDLNRARVRKTLKRNLFIYFILIINFFKVFPSQTLHEPGRCSWI